MEVSGRLYPAGALRTGQIPRYPSIRRKAGLRFHLTALKKREIFLCMLGIEPWSPLSSSLLPIHSTDQGIPKVSSQKVIHFQTHKMTNGTAPASMECCVS